MFATAKKVDRPVTPKAKAGSNRPIDVIPGWEDVCALDAIYKAIEALIKLKKGALTQVAMERLIERGLQRKGKPDTMSLQDGDAAGTISIRRRDSRQPITADEAELIADLTGEGVEVDGLNTSPGFTEVVEANPGYLAVNPAYAQDELLLKRIDKALQGVSGIPEDFIIQIESERKVVVSETATDRVFQLGPEKATQLFPMIASVVARPVHKNLRAAWAYVETLLGEVPEEAPAKRRAA